METHHNSSGKKRGLHGTRPRLKHWLRLLEKHAVPEMSHAKANSHKWMLPVWAMGKQIERRPLNQTKDAHTSFPTPPFPPTPAFQPLATRPALRAHSGSDRGIGWIGKSGDRGIGGSGEQPGPSFGARAKVQVVFHKCPKRLSEATSPFRPVTQ